MIVLLTCGFHSDFNSGLYSIERIMSTIRELSSPRFNGRMAGTREGRDTEEFVALKFKEMGLKPGGTGGTFFQEFSGISGNPSGEHILEVYDGDRAVKTYKYAKDFKCIVPYSYGGEVTAAGAVLESVTASIPESGGEIALVENFDTQILNSGPKVLTDIYNAGYRGLIVKNDSASGRKKGQFGYEDKSAASKLPRAYVTGQVFDELVDYCSRGCKIHLKSAFEVKKFTARNVIGVIKPSRPSDRYLIISAHMDHLGPDPDGTYFPGALDNASGTSCMMEIARAIMAQSRKPDINVVFIAFSGEEEMLYGSRHYVKNPIYPLKNSRVINLDMVGARNSMPLTILKAGTGHRGAGEIDIFDEFENKAKIFNFEYEVERGGASDHSPFADVGVPAVTLIDYEKVVYHVPEDTIDNIGVDNLKRVMNLVMGVIGEEIYIEGDKAGVSYIWIYAAGALVVIGAAGMIVYKKRRQREFSRYLFSLYVIPNL